MKIIIDFDPITQKVNSVTVNESTLDVTYKDNTVNSMTGVITSLPGKVEDWNITSSTKKERKKKEKIIDDSVKVKLGDNKLILTPKLVTLLDIKEGDRLSVMYKESNGFIEPFLGKAELFTGSLGNKLTKSLTVSFRGDQRESLLKYGTEFEVENMIDGSVRLISSKKIKIPELKPIIDLPQELVDILKSEDESLNLTQATFNL